MTGSYNRYQINNKNFAGEKHQGVFSKTSVYCHFDEKLLDTTAETRMKCVINMFKYEKMTQ